MICPYEYPDARPDGTYTTCGAEATHLVEFLKPGRRTFAEYCLNHAASAVNGGARWVCSHRYPCLPCMKKRIRLGRWPEPMGGMPITWCEEDRISADGP